MQAPLLDHDRWIEDIAGYMTVGRAVVVRDPTPTGATELLERIARHGLGILIQGETGTGKEVLARTLHTLSGRPGELVAINCAALAGTLLESELFGYERGAFTGATSTKPGLLEVAGRGTVLLDEIGDLPLELQGKLLRALESRQVYRVGGIRPIQLQARVIAATHRNLADQVASGEFRDDLYFRIDGITLEIPPLRERRGAIPELARGFLDEAAREAGMPAPRFTPSAVAVLVSHDWRGNVRELRSVVARALLIAGDAVVDAHHIVVSRTVDAVGDGPRSGFLSVARTHRGNASAIGRELRTSRTQVHRLARRFDVDLEALRRGDGRR